MNHGPVCVKCQVELKPEKNDVAAVYNDGEVDFEIWLCDLWKCPTCGYEILSGFGEGPMAEHYEEHFKKFLDIYTNKNRVIRFHQ